jgi:hypothetical protein
VESSVQHALLERSGNLFWRRKAKRRNSSVSVGGHGGKAVSCAFHVAHCLGLALASAGRELPSLAVDEGVHIRRALLPIIRIGSVGNINDGIGSLGRAGQPNVATSIFRHGWNIQRDGIGASASFLRRALDRASVAAAGGHALAFIQISDSESDRLGRATTVSWGFSIRGGSKFNLGRGGSRSADVGVRPR